MVTNLGIVVPGGPWHMRSFPFFLSVSVTKKTQ